MTVVNLNSLRQKAAFDIFILEMKIVKETDCFGHLGNSENKQWPSLSTGVFWKGIGAENLLSKQLLGDCY